MTEETLRLDTLPFELLIIIFDYCSVFDLIRFSRVCKRFYDIINANTIWIKKSTQPLVTNQASERFRERCKELLSDRAKWRVSHNWQYGKYSKKQIPLQKTKAMPTLRMKNDELWWCGNSKLCGFKRAEKLNMINHTVFRSHNISCVFSTFTLTKDFIVTGDSYGCLNYWTYECESYYSVISHDSEINAIDATSEVILTGSDDNKVKLQPVLLKNESATYYGNYSVMTCSKSVWDRVWSIAADPTGCKFAVGTSGNNNVPPLQIYDIRQYNSDFIKLNHNWPRGAGILDIVWESPQTLLTCGYDTYIRKWDLRAGKCVKAWPDPTDATIYCISSDYRYTMIAGTQFNSMAVLWDQRQSQYVQLYFMKLPGNRNKSPIYSLQFDSSYLYCATDRYLVELRFSGNTEQSLNYKGLKS